MLKTKLLLVVLFFFILGPLLTFIHEFGHAILPLIEGETVIIKIGGYEGPSLELGPLSIVYASPWQPWIGYADWSGETKIPRLVMGPLFSLILAFVFFFLLKRFKEGNILLILRLSLCWVLGAFLVTAFPFNYPTFLINSPIPKSDGKQIVDLMFESRDQGK